MAFVRGFESRDKDDMVTIVRPAHPSPKIQETHILIFHQFNETADPGLASKGPQALHIGAHTWCIPYFTLQPENCFILDDGTGTAVGYIIGTPDNRTFVKQYRNDYIPFLKNQGILIPNPYDPNDPLHEMRMNVHSPEHALLEPPVEELLTNYLGHLHIDIRPGWQGKGYGVALMDAFLNHVQQQGCKGVHLGMVATNDGAERFYRRVGFGRFPHVLDGGVSGEEGRSGGVVYMVKTLAGVVV